MPIDIATGDVQLDREDFSLPGRVPLKWIRHFSTALLQSSAPLAPGWTTSLFMSLKRVGRDWHFTTSEGDLNIFADPEGSIERGHTIRLLGAFLELVRQENRFIVTHWDVDTGDIRKFVFVADRHGPLLTLVGIQDVSGDGLELKWDGMRRLIEVRQSIENRTVAVNYSSAGQISSLALVMKSGALATLVRYEYDKAGRLSAAFDRRELANRYEYDAQSRIKREVLKDGAVYMYKYDDRGRCIHFTGLDHYNEKRLKFLDTARTTIVTNSYGKSSSYQCTPSGQIAAETDPSGNRQSTLFDEYNRVVAKVDATGATTRYSYDAQGNRDFITDPLGNAHRSSFNSHHQPVSVAGPMGNVWLREYDTKQRLVATQDPLGSRWKVAYDETGSPAAIADPMGAVRRLTYVDGLVREITDWMGHPTRFSWDEFGRLTERIGPVAERTTFRYDHAGNPAEVELPDRGRLHATYDDADNLICFTNSKGQITRFRYGSCRRLLERVDSMGRVVRYEWGTESDRLDAVINEKGEKFTFIHDDQGRVVRELSFDGREQVFDYDSVGRFVAFTNGNGQKIRLKRDAAGRLIEEALPEGIVTTYQYDPVGRMVAAVNPDIPVRFEYDAAGRLVREIQGKEWVVTKYNASGEVTNTQTSLGHEVRYERDSNGRVRRLYTGSNHVLDFERDERGLETGREMPGGLRMEQRFDSMGRLLVQRVGRSTSSRGLDSSWEKGPRILSGNEVIRRDYRYDAGGLVESIKDGRWGSTDYAYDPAERLLSAFRDRGLDEHFEYDATDNLTRSQQQDPESISDHSCYYGPGNRLLKRDDTLYEYDVDGRLVRKTEFASSDTPKVWKYKWDSKGQFRRLDRPDGDSWEYKYDPFGRRFLKVGPNSIRHFLWDGEVVIQESQEAHESVAWLTNHGSFAPLAKVYNGELFSIVNDHLGTPREMMDASGRVVWAASLTAWGLLDCELDCSPEHSCPIRFQGQWFDEESGLHYNRFRYYDPALGRFLSSDPIRLAGGRNTYQYVVNPVGAIDPFGLTGKSCTETVAVEPEEAKTNVLPSTGSVFIVSPGGVVIVAPAGAVGPTPVVNPSGNVTGFAFTGGSGGPGIDSRVTDVRIMDPTPPKGASPGYPTGYAAYNNAAGQGVNPSTGRTVPNSDPTRHIPL